MNPGCRAALLLSSVLVSGPVLADSPACNTPEARQFDFWIGEWDISNRQANPAAPSSAALYPTGSAEMRVYPVADGCGIVEHWEGNLSWGRVLGFSLRAYDPQSETWSLLLNWPAPNSGKPAAFSTLEGVFRHGRGEFFSSTTGADGTVTKNRFTFSDISANRYRWDAASSIDNGLSWKSTWIMEGIRRDALTSAPVRAGPQLASVADDCAATPETEALAFLEGAWVGQTEDELPVQLEVIPILGGCAVIEHLTVGTTPQWKAFRVRAYQPGESQWIQFSVDNENGGISRFKSKPQGERVEWTSDANRKVTETWSMSAPKRLRWERSQAGTLVMQAELTTRP